MKKIIDFFVLAAYVLGTIGGIGYALFNGAYLIAVGVLVVALLALPEVKCRFEKLTE